MTRRAALATLVCSCCPATAPAMAGADSQIFKGAMADLEVRAMGRLGVAMLDTATMTRLLYRADERFPMCSTFKVLATALVLARVDRGEEDLQRRIVVTRGNLVPYSPVTEARVGGSGMSLAELCAAAITWSDNTAANLLLASFGGPAALTAYARSLGDPITRLDRTEPALNEATPGDPRDTTSPAAMLGNLHKLVLGDALSAPSRQHLTNWLLASTTGDARLRAGLPDDWRVGDKTGSSLNGVANDIAVAWPPGRAPLIVTAYLAESMAAPEERDAVLADVARGIVAAR